MQSPQDTDLRLQLTKNQFSCLHDRIGLASHHDGQRVVFGLTDLDIATGLLHHVLDDDGLFGLASEDLVELSSAFFHRDMKDL